MVPASGDTGRSQRRGSGRIITSVLALFLAVVAAIELARGLPLVAAFRHLALCGARARGIMLRRGVSDASKERGARILSVMMFRASIRALSLLLVVVAPIGIVLLVGDALGMRTASLLLNVRARLALLGLCLCYAGLRFLLRKQLQPR